MSQVNFIITEGDEFYNKHKNKFIELYTNGASNKEIIEQLNITRTQCNTFRRRLHCEGKITPNTIITIKEQNCSSYEKGGDITLLLKKKNKQYNMLN